MMELRLIVGVMVVVTISVTTEALPTKLEISGTTTALLYLDKFGYMNSTATNPENGALLSEAAVRQAILDFQAFAGLNQTGNLDQETVEMMNRPRCGNRDIIGHGPNTRRRKRYALQGSRWRVRDLTYQISKYPTGLKASDVDEEVANAFKVWEDVSNLTFRPTTTGKVHIDIRFEKGEHGDGDPFDGRGGTLAHAYFPIYGGDAHFDDTEQWTIDSFAGTNLFQVAAHEFGHSLGLSHSDVRSALMAPFYRGYERNFELDDDDTRAIQALYGKRESPSQSTPSRVPTAATTRRPSTGAGTAGVLCSDASVDTIVTMADKNTYVFKGSQYWLLTDSSTAPGYPRSTTADWGGLPGNLDAAFTWSNGKTYFLKGSEYWRFSNMTMDPGYPKPISKGFAGIPDNVDSAFVWSGNGKIYFFKNDKYWRFEPTARPPVGAKYPKDVSNWEGIPNNIDAALQYSNGFTYFFKDGMYWRFNDRTFRIDTADPPFPRPAGYWWFGCETSGSQTLLSNRRTDEISPSDYDVREDNFDAAAASDSLFSGFSIFT
ncbi:matrix metalloproteinase-2 isoform X2 [Hyalella azteca]|uniref:Matrix metalloproteinase-2 isoform X2 n=1 Tax=Hyalella azteca TaxID=294128 RepID=A0A8B7N924_HYAAZ|nr:matrix metalloproteinase-2 isoform X2 [Hyalella azteca]